MSDAKGCQKRSEYLAFLNVLNTWKIDGWAIRDDIVFNLESTANGLKA